MANSLKSEVLKIDAYIPSKPAAFSLSHHAGNIRSYCLVFDELLPEESFAYWLELMSTMRAENILRIKGIIEFKEKPDTPVIIHGVQQVVHPFVPMPEWPSEDTRSRLVVIGENLNGSEITVTFERYVGVRASLL